MSDQSPFKLEQPPSANAFEEKFREYRAERKRQYDAALARLEDASLEPEQRSAYEATLNEMLALPLGEVAWPMADPRFRLHQAMEYGDQLETRRADIEVRFECRLPPSEVYAIKRYALAALHAFKQQRSNPEPEGSFGSVLKKAALLRSQLRSVAACFLAHEELRMTELRNFDGGITPESIACDLFLLSGVLENLSPELKERMMAGPLHLMEATIVARDLLHQVTQSGSAVDLWQPTLFYGRALTLVDRASHEAELVLSEFHNDERDPATTSEWISACLFCACDIERQRHLRREESLQTARRRASFVSSTMTAALGRPVVKH